MIRNRKKKLKTYTAISRVVLFAFAVIAYLYINRGVAVEIASDVAVGEEVTVPFANGELRGSLFAAGGSDLLRWSW